MKRRVINLLLLILLIFSFGSCSNKNVLLFLNWGEYIDEELLEDFEEKYNCTVVMDLGESNEIFYSKVRSGTTVYDVVCPSDYMVEKMYAKDMLLKLDFDKLPNYNKNNLLVGVNHIITEMEENHSGISDYFVPYLWGTWGIMYSTEKEGLKDAINSTDKEWNILFDRNSLPKNTNVAMYDSHLHAYYAACKYLEFDPYVELDDEKLDEIYDLVRQMNFDVWGTDNIKKDIVAGNVDLGFMWTGDFLYYYAEQIAARVIEAYSNKDITIDEIHLMIEALTSNNGIYVSKSNKEYKVGFDLYIPSDTIAFSDNLVIPKDSDNVDLAHKFINFMASNEVSIGNSKVTPAYSNAYYVCYNTPFNNVFDSLVSLSNYDFNNEDNLDYIDEIESGVEAYDTTLYYNIYDVAIGIAFDKYYKKDEAKGHILAAFDRKYINTINTTFNNARA
jgi:spermidine/putrescine-binding protein